MTEYVKKLFDVAGKVAIITGSTGVLGGAMARGLAQAGVKVAILGRRRERAESVASEIRAAGGEALATPADVLDQAQLLQVRETILKSWGQIDILVNAAGGNIPGAVLMPDKTFFELSLEAFHQVFDLNFHGTTLPILIFGQAMGERGQGAIINISSMASQRVITRVVGYSAAKASIDNLTRWLAVEMSHKYGGGLRVNAIAPGFFVGEQNRNLLLNEDVSLTARGQIIVDHTPMGRFGEPDELIGTLLWLCSDAAKFVTGVVVPVDGGFSVLAESEGATALGLKSYHPPVCLEKGRDKASRQAVRPLLF